MTGYKLREVRFILFSAVGLLIGNFLLAQEPVEKPSDLQQFQGNWKLTSLEIDGNRRGASGEEQGKLLVVKDRQMQFGETGFAFEINEETNPKLFDVTLFPKLENERGFEGIYKLDKNTLTLCVYLDEGTKRRPDQFATKAGSRILLIEFEKVD